ncbi:MAG TPA: NUDIX domain-containing protein [Dongiaceae bacterium]|jgi:nudix-type nucleoside diphosphatase (YffH/AdpP family)|nr:NUDIX domain-containing protein [Dongiaceae bacterium]
MTEHLSTSDRVRIERVDVLSDNWYHLRKYTFAYRRNDGTEQRQEREAYDRGNGAVILLHNRERGTIILTRQFRLPTFVNGNPDGMLLELPAGLLDDDDPATAIRREAEEETGYRIKDVKEVFSAYMSPGSVTERLHFFTASYSAADRVSQGGGHEGEGEDIEVVEVTLKDALAMIERGGIIDAKTIMLIYHAALKGIG